VRVACDVAHGLAHKDVAQQGNTGEVKQAANRVEDVFIDFAQRHIGQLEKICHKEKQECGDHGVALPASGLHAQKSSR
jgi:phosphoribosylaminoimidazole (AIR) synthetase